MSPNPFCPQLIFHISMYRTVMVKCDTCGNLMRTAYHPTYGCIYKIVTSLVSQKNISDIHKNHLTNVSILRKLLDNHFRVSISQYHYHRNMFEDLVEGLLMQNQYSTETIFTCWTRWKNNIMLALRNLSTYQAGDPNEHIKFVVNYLGVRKVNDTGLYSSLNSVG
jgi:hypothetical protein